MLCNFLCTVMSGILNSINISVQSRLTLGHMSSCATQSIEKLTQLEHVVKNKFSKFFVANWRTNLTFQLDIRTKSSKTRHETTFLLMTQRALTWFLCVPQVFNLNPKRRGEITKLFIAININGSEATDTRKSVLMSSRKKSGERKERKSIIFLAKQFFGCFLIQCHHHHHRIGTTRFTEGEKKIWFCVLRTQRKKPWSPLPTARTDMLHEHITTGKCRGN